MQYSFRSKSSEGGFATATQLRVNRYSVSPHNQVQHRKPNTSASAPAFASGVHGVMHKKRLSP